MTTTTIDDTVQMPRVGRSKIDNQGSTLTFRSRHLFGLAPVHGTMAISHGVVDVADPITASSVHVEIDTTSFDTGSRQRDGDVRSARFLDAERYPSMMFTSERLDRSEGRWMLAGTPSRATTNRVCGRCRRSKSTAWSSPLVRFARCLRGSRLA